MCTKIIKLLLFIVVGGVGLAFVFPKTTYAQTTNTIFKIVDAPTQVATNGYAYAPTIIKDNGTYNIFFCSTGNFDYIRYTSSTDGINWSTPTVAISTNPSATNGQGINYSACDPSLVYFQGYYYLFYGSDTDQYGGVIQVARSANIAGPYLTYTDQGSWEDNPKNPKMIILPQVSPPAGGVFYGAGEPTVIVHDNKLYMWYIDDSVNTATERGQVWPDFLRVSTNPVDWSASTPQKITIPLGTYSGYSTSSIDIKYDSVNNSFVMVAPVNQMGATSFLGLSTSSDGINWTTFSRILPTTVSTPFLNNVGVSSNNTGTLLPGTNLVGFAAPYDLHATADVWGQWDLYGVFVNLSTPIPGDLNNDGKVDINDYNLLVAKFGHPYTIFDYNNLVANFGK